jgi:hypothetical protein
MSFDARGGIQCFLHQERAFHRQPTLFGRPLGERAPEDLHEGISGTGDFSPIYGTHQMALSGLIAATTA